MNNPKRVLLLGAGGMGMAPLALYLHGAGVQVEAYDDCFREPLRSHLQSVGINVLSEPTPLYKPDCVIRSSAIPLNNKLVQGWISQSIPVYQRGEFLARFTAKKKFLAIVGSHGKTSTAGMLCWALDQVGFQFSYLVGGMFTDNKFPSGRYVKEGWVICEVDESDGTIDYFTPSVTLALNCDWDHVDQYDSKDSMGETFRSLFSRTISSIITPTNSELSKWAKLENESLLSTFDLKSEPSAFLENNIAAVVAAGKALEVDLSLIFYLYLGI